MARRFVKFQTGGRDRSTGERSDQIEHDSDAQDCKGLCVNCAKRGSCLLPEREGGVWHCEEYVEEQ